MYKPSNTSQNLGWEKVRTLEAALGLPLFNDPELLLRAFRHWSNTGAREDRNNNEDLERFGDAVLKVWFYRILLTNDGSAKPAFARGLERIVLSNRFLGKVGLQLGMLELAAFSKEYKKRLDHDRTGRQASALAADLFEAVIGALTLDRGEIEAYIWLDRILRDQVFSITEAEVRAENALFIERGSDQGMSLSRMRAELDKAGFPAVRLSFQVSAVTKDGHAEIGTSSHTMNAAFRNLVALMVSKVRGT